MQRRRINYVLTIDLIETWIATAHARNEAQGVLLLIQLEVVLVQRAVVTEATCERLTMRTT